MKKNLVMASLIVGSIVMLTGCGKTDYSKLVTLPDYTKVEVEVEPVNVTEEDVNKTIDNILTNVASNVEVTDRAVQEGDTVNIDFVGKIDGEAFEGGTSGEGGYDLKIGSKSFIEGFEEGLVGATLGETRDLDLVFPETYQKEELQGQPVTFTVTVNKIMEEQTPELTDALVPSLNAECKTVDEYKAYVKEQLEAQAQAQYNDTLANNVFGKIYDEANVTEIPSDMLEANRATWKTNDEGIAGYYGLTLDEYLVQNNIEKEAYNKQFEEKVNSSARQELLFRVVADKEGVSVNEKDIKEFAEQAYAQNGYASADVYIEKVGKHAIEVYLISEKVMDKLAEYAVVK